ncbi:MAG: U-box domain protein [Harvfovirus sp.]|uniref:U-box domain protein n=1 Tax=Harvfovirus sp. TaxID=2487768 RepID=A0A3G5A401_9VIRU|nr:MAG: U-box domain protein [Harvfovirus sp.]
MSLVKIFDIQVSGDDSGDILDEIDIFIMQRVSELSEMNKILDYFTQCYLREGKEGAITVQHFSTYILVDMEGDTVSKIIKHLDVSHLDLIQAFFKYHKSTDDDMENTFKKAYLAMDYELRLKQLTVLFQNKYIRGNTFQEVFENGIINETRGFFSLFNNTAVPDWTVNISKLIPILEQYLTDKESCISLVRLCYEHLKLNVSYSFVQHSYINTNKCSSVKQVCMIMKILLHVWKFKAKGESLSEFGQRTDYEIKPTDTPVNEIALTTIYSIKICYNPLMRIYKKLKRSCQLLEEQIAYAYNATERASILRQKKDQDLQLKRIKFLSHDPILMDMVLEFVDWFASERVFGTDDIATDMIDFILNKTVIVSSQITTKCSVNIVKYLINIVSGSSIAGPNKHVRFAACTALQKMCEKYTYKYFTDMNMNSESHTTRELFSAILKFIGTVDYFEWTPPPQCYVFYQNALDLISYYCNKVPPKEVDHKEMETVFHKIASRMNVLITSLTDLSKHIVIKVTNNMTAAYIKEECSDIVIEYLKTCMVSIQTLQKLLTCNIIDITGFETELILPLNAFAVALFLFLRDGSNPIYTVFHFNMETLDLMQELFKLINIACANTNFTTNIKDHKELLKEMMGRTKLSKDLRMSLVKHLEDIDNTVDEEEVPEEFLDPFLVTEIKNPVMIPDINKIFDKVSIMSHLYEQQTNPCTLDKLTIHEFEEYNKRDEIQRSVGDFLKKLMDYKSSKRKN